MERAVELGERGVQVAAYVGGDLVIDSWSGSADGTAVSAETLFPIFTKSIVLTALHVQAERGLVDYGATVAGYWPEFAAHGKRDITVVDVLTHRSGVPQMPLGVTLEQLGDWEWMVRELAAQEPLGPRGMTAYHAVSYSWILGEVIVRTDPRHRPLARFIQEEIFDAIGIEDIWVSTPPVDRHVATVDPMPAANPALRPRIRELTWPASVSGDLLLSSAAAHGALPATGGIVNARSVARFYALLANGGELDGVRLLSEERLRRLTVPRRDPLAVDETLLRPTWLGVGGFWLGGESPPAEPVVGNGPHILCHPGLGGSIGWADLDSKLAVAICHNRSFVVDPAAPPDMHPFLAIGEAARAVAAELAQHARSER